MRRLARRLFTLCHTWPMPCLAAKVGDELAMHLFERAKRRAHSHWQRCWASVFCGACVGMSLWPFPPHVRASCFIAGFVICLVVLLAFVKPRVQRSLREVLTACGHCVSCGYNLRATPGRCPECGTAPVARPDEPSANAAVYSSRPARGARRAARFAAVRRRRRGRLTSVVGNHKMITPLSPEWVRQIAWMVDAWEVALWSTYEMYDTVLLRNVIQLRRGPLLPVRKAFRMHMYWRELAEKAVAQRQDILQELERTRSRSGYSVFYSVTLLSQPDTFSHVLLTATIERSHNDAEPIHRLVRSALHLPVDPSNTTRGMHRISEQLA